MQTSNQDLRQLFDPKHTALVVIDKQEGYIKRDNVSTETLQQAVPRIDEFIELARRNGVVVVWTKMVENIDDAPDNLRLIMSCDEEYQDITREGETSFEVYGAVKPLPTETIIVKNRYNAFADTNLTQTLLEKSIKTVLLVGGYASRCVFATAIGASDKGFHTIVIRDLVANTDASENEVPVALDIIEAIHGFVLDTDRIKDSWSEVS